MTPRSWFITPILTFAFAGGTTLAAQPNASSRLGELEDREAIGLVIRDYGRLLDERKFDEFGRLFAEDGVYVAGTTTRGPVAIAESLRRNWY
ncbi:MAG: nuclear transport factor 2 family protein [Pseudomonadota bacterium]